MVSRNRLLAGLSVLLLVAFATVAMAASTGPYSSAVLADNPVLYWQMDEASGTSLSDSSGAGHGGTISGSASVNAAPLVNQGRAAQFTNAAATTAPGITLPGNRGSVELWANSPAIATSLVQVFAVQTGVNSSGTTQGRWIEIDRSGSGRVVGIVGASRYLNGASRSFTAGKTAHIVVTYDGATARLYVNGALNDSAAYSESIAPEPNSRAGAGSTFSATGTASRRPFEGRLDEIAVYDYALSSGDIAAHYSAGTN